MANAVFYEDTYKVDTYRTVYMKYLMCNYNDITIRKIDTTVAKSGYYGINGTFFNGGARAITGIAIQDGKQVRNYGLINRDPQGTGGSSAVACGTFFKLKQTENTVFLGTADIAVYDKTVYDGATLTLANTLYAIGGVSLYPSDTSLTRSTYDQKISTQMTDESSRIATAARSAIIYVGGSSTGLNTVLLTVQGANLTTSGNDTLTNNRGGVSLWELRTLINEKFAPMISSTAKTVVHAIALDGGASTQIAYKKNNKTYSYMSSYDGGSNTTNNVYTMLSVPM